MNRVRLGATFLLAFLSLATCISSAQSSRDLEILNQGRVLMFERKWEPAYGAFQRLIAEFPRSALLSQAYFLSARCLQLQGREAEGIRAYEMFLQKFPNEAAQQVAGATSVVELSAALIDKGDNSYRDRLMAGLSSPKKEVRYFAAIRCARLKDARLASMAIPVLKEIVENENEPDFADRAKIALLKLDPKALSKGSAGQGTKGKARSSGPTPQTRMLHLVIIPNGSPKPAVELNVPVSLAQMAVAALDDSAKSELRKKGFDLENIIKDLSRLGPGDVLTLRDNEKLVKLWIQ